MDEPPIRRRNRLSLVCEPCKRRKVKCDKGRPCTSCAKNNFPHKCVYGPNRISNKNEMVMKVDLSSRASVSSASSNGSAGTYHAASSSTNGGGGAASKLDHHHHPVSIAYDSSSSSQSSSNTDQMILVSASELNALRDRLHKLELKLNGDALTDPTSLSSISSSPSTMPTSKYSHTPVDPNSNDLFSVKYREINISVDKNSPKLVYNQYVYDAKIRDLASPLNRKTQLFAISPQGAAGKPSPEDYNNLTFNSSNFSNAYGLSPDSTGSSSGGASDGAVGSLLSSENMIGVNPYGSADDTINFYDEHACLINSGASRRTNYGPFSWASISRKDKSLLFLRKYTQRQQKESLQKLSRSSRSDEANQDKFEKKELESDGVVDLLPFRGSPAPAAASSSSAPATSASSFQHDSSSSSSSHAKLNRRGPSLSRRPQLKVSDTTLIHPIPSGSQFDSEIKLVSKIESILPRQRILWTLISRFFSFIYPYFPFVDEREFRSDMNRILGPEDYNDQRIAKLNINKRMDFAHLGILMIIIRLSYLSVASSHSKYRRDPALSQTNEYLLKYPVETNVIDVAKSCINQFQIMRKFNFTVFQCTFFLRLYHIYAPEEGDGADGGDSQVFNGMLVQMAYSIGLNRESMSSEDDSFLDERTKSLGRKIWYHIVINDFVQGYTFGSPLNTSDLYYDTKYPFLNPGVNENILDSDLEKIVLDFYGNCDGLLRGPMKYVLRLALDVKGKSKMSELTKHLNFLEMGTYKQFGKVGDYLKPVENANQKTQMQNVLYLKIALSMKSFYLSVFYHLYLHYEAQGDLVIGFYYLKKMLAVSVGDILPYIFPLVYAIHEFFGDGVDIVLNPSILQTIHRTSEINIAAIVRINFVIFELKSDPNHEYKLKTEEEYRRYYFSCLKMAEDMEKCARICIASLSELSDRYYYAWGAARSQSFVLKVVTNEDFYANSSREDRNISKLTTKQLEELVSLYAAPLTLAEQIVNKYCKNTKHSQIFKKRTHDESSELSSEERDVLGDGHMPPGRKSAKSSFYSTTSIPPPLTASTNNSLSVPGNGSGFGLSDLLPGYASSKINNFSAPPETPSFIRTQSNVITSEFEDMSFKNSAEIDNLWLQMLSTKVDSTATRESSTNSASGNPGLDFALRARSTGSHGSFDSNRGSGSGSQTSSANSELNTQLNLNNNFNNQVTGSKGYQNPNGINVWDNNNNIGNNFDAMQNLNFEDTSHFNFFSDLPLDQIFQNL